MVVGLWSPLNSKEWSGPYHMHLACAPVHVRWEYVNILVHLVSVHVWVCEIKHDSTLVHDPYGELYHLPVLHYG